MEFRLPSLHRQVTAAKDKAREDTGRRLVDLLAGMAYLSDVYTLEDYPPGDSHIPPWEKENHRLKMPFLGGYVSSLEGKSKISIWILLMTDFLLGARGSSSMDSFYV